ncbi:MULTISPECIES: creatininase family protein [Sedimentibacter]|uniref:Creatinine amidohydrolase n=1 Tax=Sedimentibacter saalensis TaxID=130788 RepID=A0A562J4P2_9FIRM|nr:MULTISPECIES: creatininase family protein [Sedimentibacter]TWH78158.1 creatinine amidohydrolase [Sedimentibacter saalensis]
MRLSNLTWPKAKKYFDENDMVIIAIGSIECHGRHLPLGTDTLIPDKILELIEEKSDVLIAPTIPYGACQSLEDYPGTINIDNEVLYQFLYSVIDNLYRHGARKLLILNGHGGNIKVIERIGLSFEKKGAMVVMLNWWLMAWDMNPKWKGGHGGGEETAGVMGVDPSLVDEEEIGGPLELKNISDNLVATGFRTIRFKGVEFEVLRNTPNVTENGWIGPDHPNTATVEWGKEMLQTTANYIVDLIEELKLVKL